MAAECLTNCSRRTASPPLNSNVSLFKKGNFMKAYKLIAVFSFSALTPLLAISSQSAICTQEVGKILFLASEVSQEFGCAVRDGKESFVNQVISVDGNILKIKNLENGVIWERKDKFCGYKSQDAAQKATKQAVDECKSKKTSR